MKTSELRDWLYDYAEAFCENDEVMYGMYWTVHKKRKLLQINNWVDKTVANKLIDYTETEIEERG